METTISQFIYCEKIQTIVMPNGRISKNHITPLTELNPLYLPTHYSFAMTFTVLGITPNQSNHLQLKFKNPEHKTIESLNIDNFTPPKEIIKPDKTSYSTTVDVEIQNAILSMAGTYTTEICFNNKKIGTFSIEVNKQ